MQNSQTTFVYTLGEFTTARNQSFFLYCIDLQTVYTQSKNNIGNNRQIGQDLMTKSAKQIE